MNLGQADRPQFLPPRGASCQTRMEHRLADYVQRYRERCKELAKKRGWRGTATELGQ